MLNLNSPEISIAIQSVRKAALLVRRVQAELVSPALTKEDRSPVTVADFAAQAVVASLLADAFPKDPLVAEESAFALKARGAERTLEMVTRFVSRVVGPATSDQVCDWIDRGQSEPAGRFWVLDPIDGTKGFLRHDQYAVALALVQDGEVLIGALGCPNLVQAASPDFQGPGSLVIAARGQGAWSSSLEAPGDYIPLHVSRVSNPAQARLLCSVESAHTNVSQTSQVTASMGIQVSPVQMDSQAKYAVLAAGGGDLLMRLLSASRPDYREKIWDQAAGSLVLEEAGGRITDLDGKALDFTAGRVLVQNRGILASNGWLHSFALEAIQKIGA